MLKKLFNSTVYVRVAKNQFQIRHIENKKEIIMSAVEPFTTKRLLIGEYRIAEKYLREGIKKVHQGRWLPASPVVIMHPLEMVDGGLSEIEERVLKELATGAGARKVILWLGHELSDHEVIHRTTKQ